MHYYALVEIPNDVPVDEAVAEVMEPYRERWDEDTADYNDGFWDWYQIGGRWKGVLDKNYRADEDPDNQELCRYCNATGVRTDIRVSGGCNVCNGSGVAVKWPTDWKSHPSDVAYRGDMTDDDKPFTLILSSGYASKEHWNGKEFEDLSGKLDEAWNNLDPATRLVVVDYHC